MNHAVPSFVYAASSACTCLRGERLLEHLGRLLQDALMDQQIGQPAKIRVLG